MISRKRLLEFEKLQVMLASAALLSLAYWPLAGMLSSREDPMAPLAFICSSDMAGLAGTALLLFVLCALASLVTVHSRVEGAMAVGLVAMAGFSIRSGGAETLLASSGENLSRVYHLMAIETVFYAVLMFLACEIVFAVRRTASKMAPWMKRSGLLETLTDGEIDKLRAGGIELSSRDTLSEAKLGGFADYLLHRHFSKSESESDDKSGTGSPIGHLMFLGVGLVAGLVFASLLMRSAQRGQILFSLFIGYMLAAMLAYHFFPVSRPYVAWIMPLLTAMVLYVVASMGRRDTDSVSIAAMASLYKTLPLDWLAAGCSGSLLGAWVGRRMRDFRIMEVLGGEDSKQG
jgi:hypothetical protein